jgi:hypothetical protein
MTGMSGSGASFVAATCGFCGVAASCLQEWQEAVLIRTNDAARRRRRMEPPEMRRGVQHPADWLPELQ